MRKCLFIIICIAVAFHANAQCYKPNLDSADAELAKGNYIMAHYYYKRALDWRCGDKNDNGQAARAGIAKCLPILTVEGKKELNVNVAATSGKQTFSVKSVRLSSWRLNSNQSDGLTITPNVSAGLLTVSWDANVQSTPREWLITISGEGGVEESHATIKIIQAKSSFAVNGQTQLERSFSWEGGAARFDVSGIPAGQDYTISGIDATWMSIQKKSDHFFLIVNSNDSKVSARKRTLTVTCNNQTAKIQISQSDCSTKEDLKAKARINLGGLKVGEKSMIPFKKDTYKGIVNQSGQIVCLDKNFFPPVFKLDPNNFTLYSAFALVDPKRDFLTIINPHTFLKTYHINNSVQCSLLSLRNDDIKLLSQYNYNDDLDEKYTGLVQVFENLDYVIVSYMHNLDWSDDFFYYVELYRSDGTMICKDSSCIMPKLYEDGIAITYSLPDPRGYVCKYKIITRDGKKYTLPSEVGIVDGINEGIVLYRKKSEMGAFNDRYGYCYINGDIITKPKFVRAAPFSSGYAMVSKDLSHFYFIDKKGKNYLYKDVYNRRKQSFSDGFCAVQEGISTVFFDLNFVEKFRVPYRFGDDDYRAVMNDVTYRFNEGVAILSTKSNNTSYKNQLLYYDRMHHKIFGIKNYIKMYPFSNVKKISCTKDII